MQVLGALQQLVDVDCAFSTQAKDVGKMWMDNLVNLLQHVYYRVQSCGI
jgi:hypothetical protein